MHQLSDSTEQEAEGAEVVIAVGSAESVVEARQRGREMAVDIGFRNSEATMIAAAISELARNIVQYAGRGEIRLRHNGANMLYVVAADSGPGIPDTRRALKAGYSTSGRLGLGLAGVARIADEFEIFSGSRGTTVAIGMKCLCKKPPLHSR